MNRIIDFPKFKEHCATFSRGTLKELLFDWAFQRTLTELVLVDCVNTCHSNGVLKTKEETLADYINTLEGERILIGLLGRKEAARVYGAFEGITSDVKTVDWILTTDGPEHYRKLITSYCVEKSEVK